MLKAMTVYKLPALLKEAQVFSRAVRKDRKSLQGVWAHKELHVVINTQELPDNFQKFNYIF